MKRSYRIAFLAAVGLYGVYWALTLLTVTPETGYLHTANKSIIDGFSLVFSQRWSFFAPPPQKNWRLYYAFSEADSNKEIRLEALQPVLLAKRQRAPFNEAETIVDYVISGSLDQINNYLTKQRAEKARTGAAKTAAATGAGTDLQHLVDARTNLPSLKTLEGYALLVARANRLPSTYNRVKLIVTLVPIAPFDLRGKYPNNEIVSEEKLVYETTPFSLPAESQI